MDQLECKKASNHPASEREPETVRSGASVAAGAPEIGFRVAGAHGSPHGVGARPVGVPATGARAPTVVANSVPAMSARDASAGVEAGRLGVPSRDLRDSLSGTVDAALQQARELEATSFEATRTL